MEAAMTPRCKFSCYIIISLMCLVVVSVGLTRSVPKPVLAKQFISPASGLSFRGENYELYQPFVTADDVVVRELTAGLSGVEEIYKVACEWVYVSDSVLNGTEDKWLTPGEFLSGTPFYSSNPVPGCVAGDCEEQANTLVSLIRAYGIPPEDVRVVLGQVSVSETVIRGHVWAELLVNGTWMPLDPSQGVQWEENLELLVNANARPFDYYLNNPYPVPAVTAYYNDMYYFDAGNKRGNAPESWQLSGQVPEKQFAER